MAKDKDKKKSSSKKTSSSKSSSSKQTSATQKYITKVTNIGKAVPDYQEKYFKGNYTPETYEGEYTPTEFTDEYTPSAYESQYLPQIEAAINRINNWSYDPLQDASYQALAKVYGARGNLAAKNSLADAAALNGGYGSSYAVSAAQQARNQYNQELASLVPQLEQASYERQQNSLNALMDLDNMLYSRFSDDENRRLQGLQFGLDTAGFNEGNKQFAANYGLDVFNTNEANRQFAANYALDKYGANQAERHFGYNADMDKLTTAQSMFSNALSFKDRLDAKKNAARGGSGGSGRRSSGGGGYSGGGYTSTTTTTTTTDPYTKAVEAVADKKKKGIKGTASGGGILHNKQQYR